MTIERKIDIPQAHLEEVVDDYIFWDYEIVNKIDQGNGFWTLEVRKKAPSTQTPDGAGQTSTGQPAGASLASTSTAGGSASGSMIASGAHQLTNGHAILAIAKRHVGQRYGAKPPDYTDANWKGEFDCAEFASYCAYRTYGILFATRPKGKISNIESYTGYWKDDALDFDATIAWQDALRTPGAFILRYPPGDGLMGHIGMCVGDGDAIYEAHSTAKGVILGTASGRRWDIGVKLPGVAYEGMPSSTTAMLIYRLFDPPKGYDPTVEKLQIALQAQGHLGLNGFSGIYDRATYDAVIRFQQSEGLVPDGEVGSTTGARLLGEARWNDLKIQVGAVVGPSIAGHDVLTLARTIYGEARGEPSPEGQEAVANVVLNRVRSPRYPNSIAQVCLQPSQFSCWNTNDPNYAKIRSLKATDNPAIANCYAAAERVIAGQVPDHTSGALHYHSTSIATPNWVRNSPKAQITTTIGSHVFYTGIN